MFDPKLEEKYAELIVKQGVNPFKGQPIIVRASVEAISLARLVVKKAYEAGASVVKTNIIDSEISRTNYLYQTEEELKEVPDYTIDESKYFQGRNCCYIFILSSDPESMVGVDPKKLKIANVAYSKKAGPEILSYRASNHGQWTIVGYPCKAWARKVFPNDNEEVAMNKLWEAILKTVRVTKDNDPDEEWNKHNATLQEHCKIMNKYNFKELRYKNCMGTDLRISLPEGHIWEGGCEKTNNEKKIVFNPNMPTEEIFTTPHRNAVNGIVFATKPLIHSGSPIEDFWIKFEDGRIVDYDAKVGKEVLKNIIETDEGSHYLGEVALVPYDSPISKSGIIFYETLFDENASCHLAIGAAYETTVKGTEGKTKEELIKMGVNDSFTHVDFMVGSKDLSIIGITKEGEEIPVFVNGNFAF